MSRQGYLILHDQHTGAFVYYFSLEDGYLRYYEAAQCKVPRGELLLSGSKINVKAQKRRDGTPNSFFVETRKVFVRERTYTLGNPIRLELSACTNDDRQDWGRALFSWQRYYWREPDQNDELHGLADDEKTRRLLAGIVEHLNPKSTQPYFSRALSAHTQSFGQLATHQPRRRFSITTKKPFARPSASSYNNAACIALQPFKFIQKNALALQKTISMSYTTSPSSKASTASSSSPTSDNQDTTSKPYGGSIDKTDNHAHNNIYQKELCAASTRPIGTCY